GITYSVHNMKICITAVLGLYRATLDDAASPPRDDGGLRGVSEEPGKLRVHEFAAGPILGGICDETVRQLYGYLPGKGDTELFYWFFESRNNPGSSPTVIYFRGGPGASSLTSALSGNGGPCIVNDFGKSTSINEYSWNTAANVMYIDQPAGVGFSKGPIPKTSEEAAEST
ncbi:hypothetical protein FOZ62_016025, partial [Perkinsus olseni]